MDKPDTEQRKVALVTGACGFMGTHMVDLLHERDWYVIATDIAAPTGYKPPWDIFFPIDLTNAIDVRVFKMSILQHCSRLGTGLDAVFDVKGLFNYSSSIEDLRRVNVEASRNLYTILDEFFYGNDIRVIVWSAAGIYGDFPQVPATEDAPKDPKAAYLVSKWEQEQMAMTFAEGRSDLCVSALRPAGVYGPRSRYGVALPIFLASRGMMGPFFIGVKGNRGSMVHGRDVCNAALFLAEQPREIVNGQAYNVADNSSYTIEEISRFIAKEVGFPFFPRIRLPFSVMEKMTKDQMKLAEKKGRVSMLNSEMLDLLRLNAILDTAKLKGLGWQPQYPDSLQGLRETIRAYREEGWI